MPKLSAAAAKIDAAEGSAKKRRKSGAKVTQASAWILSPKHAKTVGDSAKIDAAKAAPKAMQKRRKRDAGLNTESESKRCQNR